MPPPKMSRASEARSDAVVSDIEIRSAVPDDMEALCDLYYQLHAFHVRGVPDRLAGLEASNPEDRRELASRITAVMRSGDSVILVAVLGTAVIGLAEVHVREDEPIAARVQQRFGHLQSLIVEEEVRGRGIGGALLAAGERWSRARGVAEMRVDTWEFEAGPLGFYRRLGYDSLRRTLVKRFGEPKGSPA